MPTIFSRTREQLAALVLGKLGVLASGGSASANDLAVVYEAIDLRLKEMHHLGTFWRKVAPTASTFNITANTASAAHGLTDLLFPVSLHVTVNSVDEPITIISPIYYAGLGEHTQQGDAIYAMRNGANFIFWPVPTANRTVKILYQKIIDDTEASIAPDVEVSMMKSLAILIAYDLADQFGIPESKIRRWETYAIKAERTIQNLSALEVDLLPVAVDSFGDNRTSRNKRDWHTG